MFEVTPLNDENKRVWKTAINGDTITFNILEATSQYGAFALGLRSDGFHGIALWDKGAVTLPWTRNQDGEIYVGLIAERRKNLGPETVWCIIGGIVEDGEEYETTRNRESDEEAGLNATEALPLGHSVTAHRLYFVNDLSQNEGVRMYSVFIPFDAMVPAEDSMFKLTQTELNVKRENEARFMPWKEAVTRSGDALALAAIARLVAQEL